LTAFSARAKRGSLALIGAGLVVCGAWAAGPEPLAAQVLPGHGARRPWHRATPPPGFPLQPDLTLMRSTDFRAYIRVLRFDTSARAADRRVLMLARAGRDTMLFVGRKAELAPEIGAASITRNWAAQGRVLARITLVSDSIYPHLHLHPGVSYVFVQSAGGRPDSLMAFLIGTRFDTTVTSIDTMSVRVERGSGPARFILTAGDDDMCFPCNSTWCCPKEKS
jgi:hypothetical protein